MVYFIRRMVANVLNRIGATQILLKRGNKKAIILAYHRVLDLNPSFEMDASLASASIVNFGKQMAYLAKNYNVISLGQLTNLINSNSEIPRNTVVVTFDDGYSDFYENASPILETHSIPATIFITTGFMGKKKLFWWDELAYLLNHTQKESITVSQIGTINLGQKNIALQRLKRHLKDSNDTLKKKIMIEHSEKLEVPKPQKGIFLNWKQITKLSRTNGQTELSFEAHTINHPILTRIPLSKAKDEIIASKKGLEKRLGQKVSMFCYPNGHKCDYNDEIIKILKKSGFICSVTYIPGWIGKKTRLFELNRVFVRYDDNIDMFKAKMVGLDIFLGKIYYLFNK